MSNSDPLEPSFEVRPGGRPTGELGMEFERRGRQRSPSSPIIAKSVPLPLAAKYRITWRVGVLVLCLDRCRGKAATVPQLHVLTWALQDTANYEALKRYWTGNDDGTSLRAWNPELEETLRVARASGLIAQLPNGRQSLTAEGRRLADKIAAPESEILLQERELLLALGMISTAGMWRRLNASTPSERRNTR